MSSFSTSLKGHLVLFLLLMSLPMGLRANMAEPIIEGDLPARPFTSQFVDILHEDLLIKIDSAFQQAEVEAVYHLHAEKQGLQIPLLFYAIGYDGEGNLPMARVWLDGVPIQLKQLPFYRYDSTSAEAVYFATEFGADRLYEALEIQEDSFTSISLWPEEVLYYELDLDSGLHTVRVLYQADVRTDGWDWVNVYSIRYALSPAKYWKSFGTLDLTLDASACPYPIEVNLAEPDSGNVSKIATWKLEGIPVDLLQISYTPEISEVAKILLSIGEDRISIGLLLFLWGLHIFLIFLDRKRAPYRKFSWVWLIGSLVFPGLMLLIRFGTAQLFHYTLAPHCLKEGGYTLILILGYPFVMPIYFLAMWIFDSAWKKKRTQIDTEDAT